MKEKKEFSSPFHSRDGNFSVPRRGERREISSLFFSIFLSRPHSRDGNISVARRGARRKIFLSRPHSCDGNISVARRGARRKIFLSRPHSRDGNISVARRGARRKIFLSRPHSRDGNISVARRGARRKIFLTLLSISLSSLSPTFCRSFRKLFLSLSPFFPLSPELPSLATEIFPSPDESLSFLSAASSLLCALSSLPFFSVRTLFFSLLLSLPLILSSLSLPPSCDENFPVARRGGRSFFFLSLFRRDNSFCSREREMKGERIEWRRERRESENV